MFVHVCVIEDLCNSWRRSHILCCFGVSTQFVIGFKIQDSRFKIQDSIWLVVTRRAAVSVRLCVRARIHARMSACWRCSLSPTTPRFSPLSSPRRANPSLEPAAAAEAEECDPGIMCDSWAAGARLCHMSAHQRPQPLEVGSTEISQGEQRGSKAWTQRVLSYIPCLWAMLHTHNAESWALSASWPLLHPTISVTLYWIPPSVILLVNY